MAVLRRQVEEARPEVLRSKSEVEKGKRGRGERGNKGKRKMGEGEMGKQDK